MPNRKLNAKEAEELGLPLRYGDMVGDKMFIYYSISGLGNISMYCQSREAHRATQNAADRKQRKRRRAFIQRVKIKFGCKVCGYNKCANALHFNHIKPEDKQHNIAAMAQRFSIDSIKNEIRKCEVLCANCHAEHSEAEEHHMIGNNKK